MQAKIIGISPFAMMLYLANLRDLCNCSHWESKTAVHPYDTETSVWAMKSGNTENLVAFFFVARPLSFFVS